MKIHFMIALLASLFIVSGFSRIEICFNQEDKRVAQLIKDYTDKKKEKLR